MQDVWIITLYAGHRRICDRFMKNFYRTLLRFFEGTEKERFTAADVVVGDGCDSCFAPPSRSVDTFVASVKVQRNPP